jgi:dolichyl-phosphate beta-glucosyltransferase
VPPSLSLVLPAYHEAQRLPPYLALVQTHLAAHYPDRHEAIVVDDGGGDALEAALAPLAAGWPQLRVIGHAENQGKGAAVRTGMLAAAGDLLLFADADGATPIEEEARLAAAIAAGADLAVGSRLLPGEGVRRERHWRRAAAGRLFAAVARRALGLTVRDPQCGFKMFRRDVARRLFAEQREPRFLFDLELLVRAERLGCRVAEVPVCWHEVPGGHFHMFRSLPRVLAGLWRLRRLRKGG